MMSAWVSSRVQTMRVCGRAAREHGVEVGGGRGAGEAEVAGDDGEAGRVGVAEADELDLVGGGGGGVAAPGAGAAVAGADDGEAALVGVHGRCL